MVSSSFLDYFLKLRSKMLGLSLHKFVDDEGGGYTYIIIGTTNDLPKILTFREEILAEAGEDFKVIFFTRKEPSMSAVKRPPEDPGPDGGHPMKKVMFEPLRIGPVSTLEEMDIQVLRFQHQKLKQRLELRQKQENDLRERIEQLEKRQTQDDAVLNVINRYWNQLNEDIRILLQRFDTETSDESENKNENEATTSFLTQLSTWDKDELDEKLANRVQVSTRAVAKIIQAFDRLQQRNEKITKTLKGELGESLPDSLDDAIKEANIELETENRRIQALNTSLHEKYHAMSLKMKELQEKLTAEETKGDELQNQVDDLNWEVSKLISQNDKLINHVQDLTEKYRRLQQLYGSSGGGDNKINDLAQRKVEMSEREVVNLQKDNEELRELANNRLIELDRLHLTQRETLKELEKLRMDIRQLPESIIVETTEFKCLQSKFSVVYNDNLQLRTTLDETKQHLYTMRTNHLKHIESMESEELLVQKKLRTDMIQLEDMLGQVRKEYEMLRVEFEQNLAANEQTGPINREMRHLITSLQNHNQQLKGDAHRYRKKYKEMCTENAKLKRQKDDLEIKVATILDKESVGSNASIDGYKDEEDSPTSSCLVMKDERNSEAAKKSDDDSPNEAASNSKDKIGLDTPLRKELKKEGLGKGFLGSARMKSESELIKELRSQLKKALNDQREMKLLLDMYKGASKDQRDKVQLMASERKSRQELDELKQTLKKLQDNKKEERKKLADEDAMKRIKSLEEQVHALQRQVTAQKQEEEALISEMEVTGQAFEDMQEQNSRLIQQLREKDDANFKLMSDRIKSNQLQKLAREERELLQDQVSTLAKQVDAQNQVVRKLEEKERLLLNSIASMEKEAVLRQQAMELHKRKAIESAQSAADLKLHLEKYHSQMKDAQQTVAEKTSALEAEAYKTKRLQEEIAMLRRKVERLNKIEMAGNTDEVMMEEIREYKETLTCPSCKVKRKDAVLIKCFHVFCFDCLRTRYETRQRKCPKCNAAFGANDYHRLYLS